MEEKKKTKRRMILNVPEVIYDEIKKRSEFRYVTMTQYMLQAIIEKIQKEKQYQ